MCSLWHPRESTHKGKNQLKYQPGPEILKLAYNSAVPTKTFYVLFPPFLPYTNPEGVNYSSQSEGRENDQEGEKMGLEIPLTPNPTTNVRPTKGPHPT